MDPTSPTHAQPSTVVTKRADAASAMVTTPEGTLQLVAMPAWQIMLVRTGRVYLQSLLGFLTATTTGLAGAVGVQVHAGDFWNQTLVAASLAVAPAAFTLLQNAIELLARLDVVRPTLRA